jgi:carboxyl-terminal processing protease
MPRELIFHVVELGLVSQEMNQRSVLLNRKFSQLLVSLIVLALLLPGLLVAQQKPQGPTSAGNPNSGKPTTGAPSSARRPNRSRGIASLEGDFQEALKLVEDHYIEGSKLDYNSVFKSSITGMLRSLDPHSNYFDREEFDELKTEQRSEYSGIGASIQNYVIGEEADTYITATFENAPAARAGLRFGDRIVAVDDVKMSGKPSIEVRDKIRGPRGSIVKLTVVRAANGEIETIPITRQAVPQPSIPDAYMIGPGVGYIDMTRGFNYTTSEELQNALEELHARGMTSLVLDLRGNPGGFLDQAIQVAETFLPAGELILTQKGRNGLRDSAPRSRNSSPDLTPLVILINEYTASASEIVAGAMQDHDRALIVGKTSFGKGLVQSIIHLDQGAGLTLTSAKYYTPSGRLIQRDYTNGGLYDYYTHGGVGRSDKPEKPSGPEKKTDTGRAVFGGGGITPDEDSEPRTVSLFQRRLLSPIFAFSRDLVNKRISGFDSYRLQGPIDFHHELARTDFPITDPLFNAFKEFAVAQPGLKVTAPQLDRNRAFIAQQLRFNLITAAYGRVMAERVLILSDDPQVTKAVDTLPRARDLASSAMHQ